ncbi:class I SAM-dependent methyltransferase [Pseudalkalibacillus salsuginis]|uniref:class I SAM-dependent methyltransferase n=1 Tax=Pseudalkalibacillus salsuginis TaxID=2910972 RepID=UPI001F1CD552|nr:class I SAM-dependent methyltransferase [Pseudalkalibacillus salsuginis]MCF6409325.1 class I SAM-dependent methyltransferase [Pseudalkalibacillus salsuginis]
MNKKEKLDYYIDLSKKPFSGWDFSFLSKSERVSSEPLPWSYGSTVLPLIRKAHCMLDLGTGGGELLSTFQPLPETTYATEGYPPNIPIAKGRLNSIGVEVFEVAEDNKLPFENDYFDLIINKHEAYSVEEIYRVLKPGGHFITQQVGGQDINRLNVLLGEDEDFGYGYWDLEYAEKELKSAGFSITSAKESFPYCRFYDIGAILYYLKAVPWQVPNFNIESHLNELMEIEDLLEKEAYIELNEHRFIISTLKTQ